MSLLATQIRALDLKPIRTIRQGQPAPFDGFIQDRATFQKLYDGYQTGEKCSEYLIKDCDPKGPGLDVLGYIGITLFLMAGAYEVGKNTR